MSLLKTAYIDGQWLHEVYSADTPPDELGIFAEMKALWDSKRQLPNMPSWSDFSFEDFDGYYGWLAVEDIISQSPFNTVFRLWGSRWVEAFGEELTGKQYIDVEGPYDKAEGPAFWEKMCQTDHIIISSGTMAWLDKLHRFNGCEYKDIVLPLSSDGTTVDKYLNILTIK